MKTILITGATGSIGKAVAVQLSSTTDSKLVLIGRNAGKLQETKQALKDPSLIDVVAMDLGNKASIKTGVDLIRSRYKKIDALINIAAVYKAKRETDTHGIETMFGTNHLGPFQLTMGLIDILKSTPNAVVLNVSAPSSTKLNFEDLNGEKKFSALNAFGASKMANLLFTFRLAKDFAEGNQAAIAFHPGLVKSELLKEGPALLSGFLRLVSSKPEMAAKTIAELVLKQDKNQNGKFFTKGAKELKANSYAYDSSTQNQLWEKSMEMTR